MANQLASFDPVGSFQGARANALSIQRQEQDLALQPQRNELSQLKLDTAKQGLQANQLSADQQGALTASRFVIESNQALKRLPLQQRAAAVQSLTPQAKAAGIDVGKIDLSTPLTDQRLDEAIQKSATIIQSLQGGAPPPSALDRAKTGKTVAETKKIEAETAGIGSEVEEIPLTLLSGLSDELADKGAAAFKAAGGGKDGLKAFEKTIATGSEQERRIAAPAILEQSYPEASADELIQLRATMDAAKTTESGLKAAAVLREDQRRIKTQGKLVDRAHSILVGLRDNQELGDVVGSLEGGFFLPRSDGEAEAIADIEEVANILTADKLKLMTGVLSESDIKILTNLAGGGLNRKRGEKRFKEELDILINKLDPANRVSSTGANTQLTAELDAKRARLDELRAKARNAINR